MKDGSPCKSPTAAATGNDAGDAAGTDDARAVLDAIRRIVQVLRISSRAGERELGLSAAQLFVLDRLASAAGRLSVNELAERTLTHQSSVSVVVQKLERQGLIERVRSSEDARRSELSLSPAARKLLRRAPRAAQDRIIDAVNAMAGEDRRKLAALLAGLAAAIADPTTAAPTAPPAMFFEESRSPLSQKTSQKSLPKRGARRVRSRHA